MQNSRFFSCFTLLGLALAPAMSRGQDVGYELTAEQKRIPLEAIDADASKAKIVLLAGAPSNKPGQHEYFAGCALLAHCLRQSGGVAPVMAANGWPKNEAAVFDGARAIVCFMDGGAKFAGLAPERWARLRDAVAKGAGLVMMHQAVEVPAEQKAEFQGWLGGVWQADIGFRGHWDMSFQPAAKHPVLNGVGPFSAPKDGWLCNLHFATTGVVTPILSGAVPEKARTTANAKAHADRDEVVAWAYERPGGGRSFAFTGCDLHSNWAEENQRRLVVNGILWAAGIEIPKAGAPVACEADQLKENFDRKALLPTAAKTPDSKWAVQAAADAKQDFQSIPYDGVTPNKMVCDTTLRQLPDGSWILYMLAGGDTEPSPKNHIGVTRSTDQGKTWSPLEPFNPGFPREGKTMGQGPTELMVLGTRTTLFFSTHSKHWANDWRSWFIVSDDSCKTWTQPVAMPGRLRNRTFIRKHIVCQDGRIMLPFQHYIGPADQQDREPLDRDFTNPRNGVLISADRGQTWTEHGDIRLTTDDRYFGWAEPDLFEHPDGRVTMLIRADKLGGFLFRADSPDGGKTWPDLAVATTIPNPGSKATLYNLGGDHVALLHNPNSQHRSPMALWISFDGMKTWPYQRVLQAESVDGPKGRMNYPDGFVSADGEWLHFAFDDNRHRAVHYSAKLPPR